MTHDAALGTIVFNKKKIPKTGSEEYRSVAEIKEGMLYRSKLGKFSIFKYSQDNETVAVTINQQTRSCNRAMYRKGIQNVEVLVLEDKEEFLNNKHLELAEMEEEIMFESELRGSMNSIELAIDRMYQDIN